MLLLWLAVFALVVSPQLHEAFHKDSREASHNCLVTHVQHQSLLAGAVSVAFILAAPMMEANCPSYQDFLLPPTRDYLLIPSRDPPFTFVSSWA
jgi:hypothetical protein